MLKSILLAVGCTLALCLLLAVLPWLIECHSVNRRWNGKAQ